MHRILRIKGVAASLLYIPFERSGTLKLRLYLTLPSIFVVFHIFL